MPQIDGTWTQVGRTAFPLVYLYHQRRNNSRLVTMKLDRGTPKLPYPHKKPRANQKAKSEGHGPLVLLCRMSPAHQSRSESSLHSRVQQSHLRLSDRGLFCECLSRDPWAPYMSWLSGQLSPDPMRASSHSRSWYRSSEWYYLQGASTLFAPQDS